MLTGDCFFWLMFGSFVRHGSPRRTSRQTPSRCTNFIRLQLCRGYITQRHPSSLITVYKRCLWHHSFFLLLAVLLYKKNVYLLFENITEWRFFITLLSLLITPTRLYDICSSGSLRSTSRFVPVMSVRSSWFLCKRMSVSRRNFVLNFASRVFLFTRNLLPVSRTKTCNQRRFDNENIGKMETMKCTAVLWLQMTSNY